MTIRLSDRVKRHFKKKYSLEHKETLHRFAKTKQRNTCHEAFSKDFVINLKCTLRFPNKVLKTYRDIASEYHPYRQTYRQWTEGYPSSVKDLRFQSDKSSPVDDTLSYPKGHAHAQRTNHARLKH